MAEIDSGERETAEHNTYFKDTVTGKTYQRVRDTAVVDAISSIPASASGSILSGIIWDYVAASYPTATQEIYEFRSGGSLGTIVSTVTLNYVDSSKSLILNASRT